MLKFLQMFLPLVALQLSPVLMPLIGWTIGTVKDRIVGFSTIRSAEPPHALTPPDSVQNAVRDCPEFG